MGVFLGYYFKFEFHTFFPFAASFRLTRPSYFQTRYTEPGVLFVQVNIDLPDKIGFSKVFRG